MFADGGIASSEGGMPINQEAEQKRKYREAEEKQHEKFKKNYMKRIHDEILTSKQEVTGDPQHAEDGSLIYRPQESQQNMMNPTNYVEQSSGGQNLVDKLATGDPTLMGLPAKAASVKIPMKRPEEMPKVSEPKKEAKKTATKEEEDGMSGDDLAKGLGALSELMGGSQTERGSLNLGEFSMSQPQNVMNPVGPQQFANPFRAEDGNVMYASDGSGDIVDSGMESYAGDRVDAKINDGEAVLNVPQQQRFMDLVRGKISVDELGDDDIIEGVPRDYRDDLHDKIEGKEEGMDSKKLEGLSKLLEILGDE
jgi:hypothetical protein